MCFLNSIIFYKVLSSYELVTRDFATMDYTQNRSDTKSGDFT